jgi:hypothetical protein
MENPSLLFAAQQLAVNAMAYEAVLLALIRTHHDGKALSAAIGAAAIEISAIAMQGQQSAGTQDGFDRKIAQLRQAAG